MRIKKSKNNEITDIGNHLSVCEKEMVILLVSAKFSNKGAISVLKRYLIKENRK